MSSEQQPTEPEPKRRVRGIEGAPQLAPYKFPPGKSGNPGGRPKFRAVSKAAKRLLLRYTREEIEQRSRDGKLRGDEALAASMLVSAFDDPRFASIILDRTEGKVPDEVQHSGAGDGLRIILEEARPPSAEGDL
jgi:hypothetical protein